MDTFGKKTSEQIAGQQQDAVQGVLVRVGNVLDQTSAQFAGNPQGIAAGYHTNGARMYIAGLVGMVIDNAMSCPTNLTYAQWAQTMTASFAAWFAAQGVSQPPSMAPEGVTIAINADSSMTASGGTNTGGS